MAHLESMQRSRKYGKSLTNDIYNINTTKREVCIITVTAEMYRVLILCQVLPSILSFTPPHTAQQLVC